MDRVVDRGAGEAADLEQIAALRLELGHLLDFLLAHVLEVDDDAVGAGFGDDAVERDHDDAGVAGLLDRAIQRVGRGRIDDDRVIALQDQVLDLRGLGRHFLVGGGEDIGRGDDLVRDRLLGDDVVALQHRLAPGIAGVVVGKARSSCRSCRQRRSVTGKSQRSRQTPTLRTCVPLASSQSDFPPAKVLKHQGQTSHFLGCRTSALTSRYGLTCQQN